MRVPSRRLPPWPVHPASPAVRWGCVLLLAGCVGWPVYLHPLVMGVFAAILLPGGWLAMAVERRRQRAFVARWREARPGNALCRFARDFDCRVVDTWLIRATFEEVQAAYHGVIDIPLPVRAADRWTEDLRISGDELDEIGWKVADRAGYGMDGARQNPMYGNVKTVGDLVAFMRHQPCLRAA